MYYMDKNNVVAYSVFSSLQCFLYSVTFPLMYYMDKNNVVAYSVFSTVLHSL